MGDGVSRARGAIAADAAHADPALWINRLPDDLILAREAILLAEGPQGRPLHGLTFAVKDNIDVEHQLTTAGCPGFAYLAQRSAPAVERLLEAGAILVGKTNLDQFATGLVGVRSPFGTPRNVHSAEHVPGGSSSGSATAVAAGIVDFALGTDTAGSGRVPALFGGIIGLKPTIGSIPATGMVPACRSIDTISVFARDIATALRVHAVMAEFDPTDPYSRRAPHAHLRRPALPPHVRVGIADIAGLCCAPQEAAYRRTAGLFDTAEVNIAPFLEIARLLYDGPWVSERSAVLREVVETQPDILHPTTRHILQGGLGRLTVDAFDAFHRLAHARRLAEELFTRIDALMLPTAPYTPTLAELDADPIGPNARLGTFTNFVNLCDLAAIAVPTGLGADGLPTGVTLIGPAWSEARLAMIAARITGEDLPPDPLAPDETALFCIGAHMSGLPLNSQLLTLGGRFLRDDRTVTGYRLHALGNRPGLTRAAGGASIAGEGIAGEVWSLPTAAIGALLTQVPAPLGFGTVQLETGPCLGFLAEAEGVAGTRDITALGGWRAYLAEFA